MNGLRWAFNFTNWKPIQAEWMFAAQCIQPEEKERISHFMFQKDAKAAMCGRLLIRKFLSEHLKVPYDILQLKRTEKGKPFLSNIDCLQIKPTPHFNMAHNGDFVVLATHQQAKVGIDIMKIESPSGRSLETFFNNMRRQFTENEWKIIKRQPSEILQLQMFFRHWCLKESVVKALGEGIGFGLDRLEFHLKSYPLTNDQNVTDTVFYLDGKVNQFWTFEETLLNSDHCVVVGYNFNNSDQESFSNLHCNHTSRNEIDKTDDNSEENMLSNSSNSDEHFRILSWQEMVAGSIPQSPPDEDYWLNFNSKPDHPFKR